MAVGTGRFLLLVFVYLLCFTVISIISSSNYMIMWLNSLKESSTLQNIDNETSNIRSHELVHPTISDGISFQTSNTSNETSNIRSHELHQLVPGWNFTRLADSRAILNETYRPPLSSIVDGWNITMDPQFLLDFCIMGFPKCGTSTMMNWLGQHSQAQVFSREVYDLKNNRPTKLIEKLYNNLKEGNHYKRGFKDPGAIELDHVQRRLATLFPKTKVFIGIRHPVRWMESFYNFRVHNEGRMPNANKVIGVCTRGKKGVCTKRGLFHVPLMKMGKTNLTSTFEQVLMNKHKRSFRNGPPNYGSLPNPVFLFETTQLADYNKTQLEIFRKDVQNFVGFDEEMPPIVHSKPGKNLDNATQAKRDENKIDICDKEYKPLRNVLMDIARDASEYIGKYFIESPDVTVSSPEYFREIMASWKQDPCEEEKID